MSRASDSTCSTAARVTSFRHSFIHWTVCLLPREHHFTMLSTTLQRTY